MVEFEKGFSIVLCTYNGKSRLLPTLEHLAALQIPANHVIELILVNNASTDDTATFVLETWLKLGEPFPLLILNENRPGKGFAVETGYDAARYSYILTVDDDNWLSPDYVAAAVKLFNQYPDVGVLQGQSKAAFESSPPDWIKEYEYFFVIGSPIQEPGYFPKYSYYVWGAGMVIRNSDWRYLRSLGFSFLTSKVPGKAAGEDHETAIALLLLGRKIYYSNTLNYQHFMPANRLNWNRLLNSFPVFSYVGYYILLYALVIDAYEKGYTLTSGFIKKHIIKAWLKDSKKFTWKQHLAYWIAPKNEYYQLRLKRYYALFKWIMTLSDNSMQDVKLLQSWMLPLLRQNSENLKLPTHYIT